MPGGLFSPPGIEFQPPLERFSSPPELWQRAGCRGRRMDLLIAIVQRSAVVNVSRCAADRGGRQCALRQSTGAQRIQEVTAIRAQSGAESSRNRAEVSFLSNRDTSVPCLEAIDIGRRDRSARMLATGFAMVLDVDAEYNVARHRGLAVSRVGSRCEGANA